MRISKKIQKFAYSLVLVYSTFDRDDKCYVLDINKISEFDLRELSAQLMNEDSMLAAEATGPDNVSYKDKMLPTLTQFLSDPLNGEKQYDFMEAWRKGVVHYLLPTMNEILEDQLKEYNHDHGYQLAA